MCVCFVLRKQISPYLLASLKAFGVPGGFRKVREACRNNPHLFSCDMDFLVQSCGQKTENKKYKSEALCRLMNKLQG